MLVGTLIVVAVVVVAVVVVRLVVIVVIICGHTNKHDNNSINFMFFVFFVSAE